MAAQVATTPAEDEGPSGPSGPLPHMDEGPILGIDLGTTYSCVAVYDPATQEVVVLANDEGSRTTPSYVAFTEAGRLVGQAAKAQASTNPRGTAFDVKRILGRTSDDPILHDEKRRLPYEVALAGGAPGDVDANHPKPAGHRASRKRPQIEMEWRAAKTRFAPEEISAMVLAEMRRVAAKRLGYPPVDADDDGGEEEDTDETDANRATRAADAATPASRNAAATTKKLLKGGPRRAVVTVPAHFNDAQRQATKDAGRIAGLDVVRIINEPTAAALAYGLHDASSTRNKSCVLIFDLGGGTFDVSVLSMEDGVFAVKATGGDTHLGGEDFDQALAEHLVGEYAMITVARRKNAPKDPKKRREEARKVAADVKQRDVVMRRVVLAAERAKKELSAAETTDVHVTLHDGKVLEVESLDRSAFEECCGPLFHRCLKTVKDVVKDAKFELEDVTECVLVGGSTRIPALQRMLKDLFSKTGLELCKHVHPDEAVAYGAAVQGAILRAGGSGGGRDLAPTACTDLVLLDVTPLSLGIELEGGQMSTLIKRGTPIPCAKTREYTTVDDYQTSIDVAVYEGERPHVSGNNKLGEFVVDGVERAKKGEPKVEVAFSLSADSILAVSARDKVTGAEASTKIKADRGRLTDDDVERMIADAEKYRKADAEYQKKVSYRNALEAAVFEAKNKPKADALDLDDLLEWLDYDAQDASLADLMERATRLTETYGVKVDANAHNGDA